jgi:endonuclease I
MQNYTLLARPLIRKNQNRTSKAAPSFDLRGAVAKTAMWMADEWRLCTLM